MCCIITCLLSRLWTLFVAHLLTVFTLFTQQRSWERVLYYYASLTVCSSSKEYQHRTVRSINTTNGSVCCNITWSGHAKISILDSIYRGSDSRQGQLNALALFKALEEFFLSSPNIECSKFEFFEILLVRLGQKYYRMAKKYVLLTATLMEACVVLYRHSNSDESVLYYGTNWGQSFLSSIATRIQNRDIIETVNSSNEF